MSSCRARVIKTDIQRDTIYKSTVLKITPKSLNELVVDNVCDSLGRLKTFSYTLGNDKVKTIVKTIHNKIYIEQNIDSIVDSKVNEYKSTLKDKVIEIPVTPKWVWKLLVYAILATLWILRRPLIRLIKPL